MAMAGLPSFSPKSVIEQFGWRAFRPSPLAGSETLSLAAGTPSLSPGAPVAIIAHHDPFGEIDGSVRALTAEVARCGITPIVCTTARPGLVAAWDLRDHLGGEVLVLSRPNRGYDFGSWAAVIEALPELRESEVFLMNTSLIGPFASMEPIFAAARDADKDVWALTGSHQIRPHLQTYFLRLAPGLTGRASVRDFFAEVGSVGPKMALVQRYEIGFTRMCERAGLTMGIGLSDESLGISGQNPTVAAWRSFLDHFPFAKRTLLTDKRSAVTRAQLATAVEARWHVALEDFLAREPIEAKPLAVIAHLHYRELWPEMVAHLEKLPAGYDLFVTLSEDSAFTPTPGATDPAGAGAPGSAHSESEKGESRGLCLTELIANGWLARTTGQEETHDDLSRFPARDCAAVDPAPFDPRAAAESGVHARGMDALVDEAADNGEQAIELSPLPDNAGQITVAVLPNRGRDILPMLSVLSLREFGRYQTVVKIHGKKSVWRQDSEKFAGDGDTWRAELLCGVLPSKVECAQIAREFATRDDLMVATAPGQLLGARYWGHNLPRTMALARRLGFTPNPASLQFPAGSMYWIRPEILEELRNLDLSFAEFEEETGQDDGTTAHAIERLVGLLAARAGAQMTIDQLLADPEIA